MLAIYIRSASSSRPNNFRWATLTWSAISANTRSIPASTWTKSELKELKTCYTVVTEYSHPFLIFPESLLDVAGKTCRCFCSTLDTILAMLSVLDRRFSHFWRDPLIWSRIGLLSLVGLFDRVSSRLSSFGKGWSTILNKSGWEHSTNFFPHLLQWPPKKIQHTATISNRHVDSSATKENDKIVRFHIRWRHVPDNKLYLLAAAMTLAQLVKILLARDS
jgi:hypothetical protein